MFRKSAFIVGMDVYHKKGQTTRSTAPLPASKKNAEDLSDLLLGMRYTLFRNRPIIGYTLDRG